MSLSHTPWRDRGPACLARIRDRTLSVFAVAILGAVLAPAAALADGRIAFVNQAEDGSSRTLTVGSDGTGLTEVTGGSDTAPTWSPEGDRIAFLRQIDHDGDGQGDSKEIFIVDADGTGLTRVTDNELHESAPDWSPDGTKIAYQRGGDIWVMNVDGTGDHQITSDSDFDYTPSWSPDGTRIAFDRDIGSQIAVHAVNTDGTGLTPMTSLETCTTRRRPGRPTAAAWR